MEPGIETEPSACKDHTQSIVHSNKYTHVLDNVPTRLFE